MSDAFSRAAISDIVPARGDNLFLGILAGLVAAVVGAAIWMGITVATGIHVGYVALGIGALVGYAVRLGGNGHTPVFGVIGAVFTFLSCLAGEILTVLQLASSPEHGVLEMARSVDYTALVSTILAHTDPIMYLIYGIGIFEGYKFSFRK